MGCTLARRHKNPRNVAPSWTLHGMVGVDIEWPCKRKGLCGRLRLPWHLGPVIQQTWVLTVGKIQREFQGKPQ